MSKYYKTTFTVEVLSEEPIAPDIDLDSLSYSIIEGENVGQFTLTAVEHLDSAGVKAELTKMGSDPEFFLTSECVSTSKDEVSKAKTT